MKTLQAEEAVSDVFPPRPEERRRDDFSHMKGGKPVDIFPNSV